MAKKTPKKPATVETPASRNDDLGSAVYGLAKEIKGAGDSVAEELRPLYHIEVIADNLGTLASALDGLAHATAMSVIAQYGSNEDRAVVVAYLKRWFVEEFRD
jgi:hypothetical protein